MTYIASTGESFTDADIERWALDAEQGFPNSIVEPTTPRAWEHESQPMISRTFRVPETLWNLVEARAKQEHVTTSAWLRKVLASQLQG